MYLITDYGTEQAKVREFTAGLWAERPSRTKIDKEVAMMDIECRPMRSKSQKKSDLSRATVCETVSSDRSSGDQEKDSNEPEACLEEDSGKNSSAKSTQQK